MNSAMTLGVMNCPSSDLRFAGVVWAMALRRSSMVCCSSIGGLCVGWGLQGPIAAHLRADHCRMACSWRGAAVRPRLRPSLRQGGLLANARIQQVLKHWCVRSLTLFRYPINPFAQRVEKLLRVLDHEI